MSSTTSRSARTALAITSVAAVVAVLILPAGSAGAAHGPEGVGGPYSGYSDGAAIHIDAITTGSMRLADVEVGAVDAATDSEGLQEILNAHDRPVVPADRTEKHALARSSIVEVGVGLQPPSAPNQIAPFVALSESPGGDDVDDSLLNETVGTVAHASLLRRVAKTRWNNDTCIIGEPISLAEQHLARVEVLETSAAESTPEEQGFDAALLGIDASEGGPRRAATHVATREQLFLGSGPGLGLQSVVSETLAPVTFFEGTDNEFTVEIDGPAYLSVSADGTPGGARAIYRAPTVALIQDGTVTQVVPNSPVDVRVPSGDNLIARVQLGTMNPLSGSGLGDNTTAANGRVAAAQAHVVEVTLLDVTQPELRGATVALGHMEAMSEVPAGGIMCEIPVDKSASSVNVSPGEIFTTTITVSNPFECTITNLSLTDVIEVRQGARFEVTKVTDGGSQPSGSDLSNATIRWNNLGSLAPGEEISVEVTQLAQGSAGVIEDTATASGTLTNCKAGFDSSSTDVSALAEVEVDVEGRGVLKVNASVVLGERILPATGLGALAPMLGGSALIAAAGALTRRLRKPLG